MESEMTGREMGYARVSSTEQNLDRQIDALKQYIPEENILVDKQSGKDLERDSYQALKGALGLRSGDTLYVTSLDRISRSKTDLKNELAWFKEKNVRLKVLDLPTSLIEVPEGQDWIIEMVTNVLIEVLSSMAEQERLIIRKRQHEGIEAARRRGKYLGRPRITMPDVFPNIYARWKGGDITAKAAMRILGLKRSTFYRMVKSFEKSQD